MDKLAISIGVLLNATVYLPQCFSLISLDPLLLETLLRYIVLLFPIPPSTCVLSSLVLESLSIFPHLSYFLRIKVAENTVQRSSTH